MLLKECQRQEGRFHSNLLASQIMHNSQWGLHPETPDVVLTSIFKKYDTDGNSGLDPSEFSRALSDLGVIDKHEQSALFHLADMDNGGNVDAEEFIKLIKSHEFDSILSDHDALEFVYQTYQQFKKYDADGDGQGMPLLH